ncbi:hypothetical protein HUE88_12970 [Candidatus Sulfurimonas baltica]|uniref:Uncharacterized protein n=1 Tax=Candidatus Sulfurimonas baltica TaxID=2740404 RepID=A0A7S7RPF7_9BACT|nr:hypothetical protein HUE88_12970 [Candidatus Sulfurimonas baltica]
MALSETKIINKYAIAERLFHNTTSLFHIVKSAWFTLLLSSFIALGASTILLIQSIYINPVILAILGADIVVIWIIHNKIRDRLLLTVKSPFLSAVVRRWTAWINTALLVIVFVIYQFFTTPTAEVQVINCKFLDFLSSTLRYKELIEWKLISSSMDSLDNNTSFFGWMFYLFISQGIFAWAYSKLLLSVDIPKSIIKTDDNLQIKNYFFIGFIGAILLLFVSTLIINHLYEKQHIQKMQKLVKKTYVEIESTLNKQLKSNEQKILDEIDKIIDNQIDTAFAPVYDAIPSLSSYYYSVKGEYTRIALKGHDLYCGYKNGTLVPYYNQFLPNGYKLKKCNDKMLDDEIQARINRYLFIESSFDMHINRASINVNKAIVNNISYLRDEMKSSIESLENSENISNNEQTQQQLQNINSKFDEIFEASSRDVAKKTLSGTGAVLLTSSISKTVMSKMLLKFGANGAGKAASFAAGSATGLTVCAPSGPWALLCGVVTGAVSWVGVDAAMTEIDQAFNENDFQSSVRKMIDSEKNTLKTLMKASYNKWILDVFKELEDSSNNLKSPHEQLQKNNS